MAVQPVLLPDERLILSIKPLRRFILYLFLNHKVVREILAFLIGLLLSLPIFFSVVGALRPIIMPFIIMAIILVVSIHIAVLMIILIYALLKYRWEHYWITNQRVIQRSGLIGHTFVATPIERISDVTVSRTFAEKIFGFGSVYIQTLAGQATPGMPEGAEICLKGIRNPEEIQKVILELVAKKKEVTKFLHRFC